jgi:DNA topoisomerase-1
MKLMIVESPNKTKKIQSVLGAGWEVVASVGHVGKRDGRRSPDA